MKPAEPIWVHVCVWEPQHTAAVVLAQQNAARDGTIAKLVDEHGIGTKELRAALVEHKLVTMREGSGDEYHCVECGGLMEKLLSKPGVDGRTAAIQDVVNDFDGAIERTREHRE